MRRIEQINTKIVMMISACVTVLTFIHSDNAPDGCEYMFLLPLSYGILFYHTNIKRSFFKYLGISILNLILFVRCIIHPLFSSLTGVYFHSFTNITAGGDNSFAIFLMIYETICIFIAQHYAIQNLDKLQLHIQTDVKLTHTSHYGGYIIAIIIGIASYLLFPQIPERFNFLIVKDFEFQNLNAIASVGFLFTSNMLGILFIYISTREYNKVANGLKKNKTLILLITFLSITIFWSNSRLTVLTQGISALAILKLTNLINKKQLYILVVIIGIVIVSLSSYRWFGYGDINTFYNDASNYFDNQLTENYLQSYFGGPHLIAKAVEIKAQPSFSVSLESFSNEILAQIIFIRQIFPVSDISTTVIYNKAFGFAEHNSIILPTLGQSYMYFGIVGAPILSVIFVFFLFKAEQALMKCKTIGEKYALYLLVCRLAFFPMQNINIIILSFFNFFIPLYLIVLANKKIKFSRK